MVQHCLFKMSNYFHPQDYAEQVLSRMENFFQNPWIQSRPQLRRLEHLRLETPVQPQAWTLLPELAALTQFDLCGTAPPPNGLAGIAAARSNLTGLRLMEASWIENINSIDRLPELRSVDIESGQLAEIEPLRQLSKLTTLDLDSPKVTDLAPLINVPSLRTLYLRRRMNTVDLSPLIGRNLVIYTSDKAHARRWRPKMGRTVKLRSI
jgi:Leucine-rich repeat (LRR) protein